MYLECRSCPELFYLAVCRISEMEKYKCSLSGVEKSTSLNQVLKNADPNSHYPYHINL